MAKAMNPASAGTRKPKAATPTWNNRAAHSMPLAGLKSPVRTAIPYCSLSVTWMTPSSPPATWASMKASAIRMPPAATNGIM